METAGTGGTASLGEFTSALRRRWWVVGLGAVLGLALASSYLLVAPKTYIATAAVLVQPVGGTSDNVVDGARTISDINLDTEAQLVRSQVVSGQAKVILATAELPGQLMQRVAVTVPPNTNVLRISYSANNAEEARDGAAAFAAAYLQNRRALALEANAIQERSLRQQAATLEAELEAATGVDREVKLDELTTINYRLNSIAGFNPTPGNLISDALVPKRPTSPNQFMVLFSGLALGLLIGLAGVVALERRDGRVFDWRILERRLGLPVLTDVPGAPGETPELLGAHSTGGQAYTQLRNVLMNGLSKGGVVLVAEPEPGSGADAVTANLAAAFARASHRTTVVVADVTSTVPAMLKLPHGPGLSEVLRNKKQLGEVTRDVTSVSGLSLVSPGLHLDSEVDDLEGAGIAAMLRAVRERSEIVIVRAPATSTGADAQLLGRLADVALAVVEVGRTHREAVEQAVRQWSIVGTTVPGVVTVPALGAGPEPVIVAPKKAGATGDRLTRASAVR
jgi:succinoglycan biosynthesis transport protein ExoP